MPNRPHLGEFEHLLLLALVRLKEDAYGMAIRRELEEKAGRSVGIGTVYTALDRLERKGYVASQLGDPTPERGGKAKRFYRLEKAGAESLRNNREVLGRLWEGLTLDLETDR